MAMPTNPLDPEFEFGNDLRYIGTYHVPPEGDSIVIGTYKFPYDHLAGQKLFAAVLGCPHAHCRVLDIDTSEAEALEGVKAVVTMFEHPHWQTDEVLVWGWDIAGVAATDPFIAERAVDLIKVEYEVLPFIIDPEEAMKPGAIIAGTYPDSNLPSNPRTNTRGDIEAGLAEADIIIESDTPFISPHTQNTIETPTAIAWWEGDMVYGYDQNQYPVRSNATYATQIGISANKCNIKATSGTGGYGGGGQTNEPVTCALLSKKAGMPVAIQRTRRTGLVRRRNQYVAASSIKLGVKNDGTLTAMDGIWWNWGGFNGASAGGNQNWDHTFILPHYRAQSYGVAVNTGFSAGHR